MKANSKTYIILYDFIRLYTIIIRLVTNKYQEKLYSWTTNLINNPSAIAAGILPLPPLAGQVPREI
jgi:hypothetical protein